MLVFLPNSYVENCMLKVIASQVRPLGLSRALLIGISVLIKEDPKSWPCLCAT